MKRSRLAVLLTALVVALSATRCTRADSAGCTLAAGADYHALDVGADRRSYQVVVGPRAAASDTAPLVFLWHGYGASPADILPALTPRDHWPEAIVVAPQGLPRIIEGYSERPLPGWQLAAGEQGDRDLAFFDAMLADVSQHYCVDERRIYTAGFSNGGFFSNLLGCARSDVLAAIAPVAGGGPDAPKCGAPVAARVTHGTADTVVPWSIGAESYRSWSDRARCDQVPDPVAEGCVMATGCGADVEMCTFPGAHTWPTHLTAGLVEFLRSHHREASPTRAADRPAEPAAQH